MASETSPLISKPSHGTSQAGAAKPASNTSSDKPAKSVAFMPSPTFTPNPPAAMAPPPGFPNSFPVGAKPPSSSSSGVGSSAPPVFKALNNKLRRRHSGGSSSMMAVSSANTPSKVGPQRSSKNTQKLKLLPNPVTDDVEELIDEGLPRDVYTQITRIKEPTARRDAARLGKGDRERLPRVTAYCTASELDLQGLIRFLKSRCSIRGTNPKQFDECVYSPFDYNHELKRSPDRTGYPENGKQRRFSDSDIEIEDHQKLQQNLIDLRDQPPSEENPQINTSSYPEIVGQTSEDGPVLDTHIRFPEVFLFDYGTVVIWGMTPEEETRFLNEISKFAISVLGPDDMQVENFNFYYTRDYQARIYNDFISLRDPKNYMIKLAISHALAQSVKTSLFEDLVDETIAVTSPLPAQIAETGSVQLTRKQINMQIGELFILRINIHLQGSVLDSPELMWAEPQLDPIYQAVRSYLEMDQRVELLTERLEVIADLLAVLKDQLSHRHGEYLEWIVIILIAFEIAVAAINIVVDVYGGGD